MMYDKNVPKLLVIKPQYSAWPVGFAYVLSCLERHNISFDFIDITRSQNWIKDVRILLENNDYFAVASGGLIPFYRFFQQVKDFINKYHPNVPLILGGNITKDASDHLLFDRIGINFGIVGEAETSLPRLISKIIDRDDNIGDIPGVVYKNRDGDIIKNIQRRLDLKSNNILPAWHHFDTDYYITCSGAPFLGINLRFMPVLSGRGCVGKCTFCSPSIGGFRKRPIEHVISEIEHIASKYSFDNILFYNEMFYPTAKEIRDFCHHYKQSGVNKPWITQLRVDSNADKDTFVLMKEAGCIAVSAGIESGSDRVLSLMNKKTTAEQIRSFFRNAKNADMPANGTFIVGSEGETEEDIKQTINLIIDEEINTGESLMYLYPGTASYENAVKKGLITGDVEHLEKTLGTGGLFSPEAKEYFINISDIPDDQFFDVAIREVRRYKTFVFNHYQVQNLSCKIHSSNEQLTIIMNGKCKNCGTDVVYTYNVFQGIKYVGLLGDGINDYVMICPKCFKQLSFNLSLCEEMKELRNHFSLLKDKISNKKIVIGGINSDAMFLLRIDLLGLDYDNLQGFIDFSKWYKGKHYVNYPMLDINKTVDLVPDCILMADSLSDGEEIIKKTYNKKNVQPPEILYLFPLSLRETLGKFIKTVSFKYRLVGWSQKRYIDLREICVKLGIPFPRFIVNLAQYFKSSINQNFS
jgi:radical SAM superfamily enzyme YgiQ (UPF0313 family)